MKQQTQLFLSIKALRRKGNAMLEGMESCKKEGDFAKCTREMEIAITHIEESVMWLGKALGKLGSDLPARYKDLPEEKEKWYTPAIELFRKDEKSV